MGFNKKFFSTGGIVASTPPAAAGLDPLQNFETVTYTGTGATQKITGYIRKGAAFNGSSSDIDLGTIIDFGSSNYTVSFFFNASVVGGGKAFFATYNGSGLLINIESNNKLRFYHSGGTAIDIQTLSTLSTDTWYHVACVMNHNSIAELYLNGVSQGTATGSNLGNESGGNAVIGNYPGGSYYFSGKIDQVRIFDEALNSTQVGELADEEYGDATVSTTDFGGYGGVALYQLDEDANDTGGSFGSLVTGSKIDLDVDGYTSGSVSDLSGNSNTATVTGATYGTDSNGGGYFDLDGSSDYLQISASTDFNSATNFTVEGWFNPDNLTAADHLFAIYGGASDRKLFLRLNNTSGDLDWQIYNSSGASAGYFTTSNANARLTANQWNHVAVTHINNGSMEVFVNGVSAGTGTSTGINTTGTEDLYIGVLNTFIGSYDFDGKVGDIRFYDSALTSSQIVQNFNASKGSYGGGYHGTPTNVNFLGMAFAPDFVWIKGRDYSDFHAIYDSVRGIHNLSSHSTNGEGSNTTILTSFDSNGFSLGIDQANIANQSTRSYVAWCWKAGGTAVSGTGTSGITNVEVSANTEAGFSIVKYDGGGTAGGTVTHGLDSAPELVIVKRTDTSGDWIVGSDYLTSWGHILQLNLSDAEAGYAGFNSTAPTASVFTLGSNNPVNSSSGNYIAYCFHSVDSYQRIGSYTGNGDGSYNNSSVAKSIDIGFKPRFVLIKKTDAAEHWELFDSERKNTSTTYGNFNRLNPNLTNAETTSYSNYWNIVDFTDTGFDLGEDPSGRVNANNAKYLYWAIA